MIVPLTKTSDGKLHTIGPNRKPGRPLNLNGPFAEVRRAITKRIQRLERRRAKLAREIRRWNETASAMERVS